jgi:hypothetical protein
MARNAAPFDAFPRRRICGNCRISTISAVSVHVEFGPMNLSKDLQDLGGVNGEFGLIRFDFPQVVITMYVRREIQDLGIMLQVSAGTDGCCRQTSGTRAAEFVEIAEFPQIRRRGRTGKPKAPGM